jgi:AAA15 family ATPase/GTPase
MQLKSFTAKNFKSLRNTPVTKLKSINLFWGINNTGKSNLLKFLELIFKRKLAANIVKYEEDGQTKERVQYLSTGDFWNGEISGSDYFFHKNRKNDSIEFEILIDMHKNEIPIYELLRSKNFIRSNHENIPVAITGKIISNPANSYSNIELSDVS